MDLLQLYHLVSLAKHCTLFLIFQQETFEIGKADNQKNKQLYLETFYFAVRHEAALIIVNIQKTIPVFTRKSTKHIDICYAVIYDGNDDKVFETEYNRLDLADSITKELHPVLALYFVNNSYCHYTRIFGCREIIKHSNLLTSQLRWLEYPIIYMHSHGFVGYAMDVDNKHFGPIAAQPLVMSLQPVQSLGNLLVLLRNQISPKLHKFLVDRDELINAHQISYIWDRLKSMLHNQNLSVPIYYAREYRAGKLVDFPIPFFSRIVGLRTLYAISNDISAEYTQTSRANDINSLLRPFPSIIWLVILVSYTSGGFVLLLFGTKNPLEVIVRICLEQGINLTKQLQRPYIYHVVGVLIMSTLILRQLYLFDMYTQLTQPAKVTLPNIYDAVQKDNFTTVVTMPLSYINDPLGDGKQNIRESWVHKILKNSFLPFDMGIIRMITGTSSVNICPWQMVFCPHSSMTSASTHKLLLLLRFPSMVVSVRERLVMKAILLGSNRSYFVTNNEQYFSVWSGLILGRSWDTAAVVNLLGQLEQGGILKWLSEQQDDSNNRRNSEELHSVGLTYYNFMNLFTQMRNRKFSDADNQLFTRISNNFVHVTISDIRVLWTICVVMWTFSLLSFMMEQLTNLGKIAYILL